MEEIKKHLINVLFRQLILAILWYMILLFSKFQTNKEANKKEKNI